MYYESTCTTKSTAVDPVEKLQELLVPVSRLLDPRADVMIESLPLRHEYRAHLAKPAAEKPQIGFGRVMLGFVRLALLAAALDFNLARYFFPPRTFRQVVRYDSLSYESIQPNVCLYVFFACVVQRSSGVVNAVDSIRMWQGAWSLLDHGIELLHRRVQPLLCRANIFL
jgi:hypothetical protein